LFSIKIKAFLSLSTAEIKVFYQAKGLQFRVKSSKIFISLLYEEKGIL
jgi:hypothetical protein